MDLTDTVAARGIQATTAIAAAATTAMHGPAMAAIVAMNSVAPEIVAVEVPTTVDTAAPVAVGDRLVVAVVPVAVAAAEIHARRSMEIAALLFTGP